MHDRILLIKFPQASPVEDGGEVEEAGEEDRPDSVASKTGKKEPKLTNQFNFSERASQTLNNPLRVGRTTCSCYSSNLCLITTHILYIVGLVEMTNIKKRKF